MAHGFRGLVHGWPAQPHWALGRWNLREEGHGRGTLFMATWKQRERKGKGPQGRKLLEHAPVTHFLQAPDLPPVKLGRTD